MKTQLLLSIMVAGVTATCLAASDGGSGLTGSRGAGTIIGGPNNSGTATRGPTAGLPNGNASGVGMQNGSGNQNNQNVPATLNSPNGNNNVNNPNNVNNANNGNPPGARQGINQINNQNPANVNMPNGANTPNSGQNPNPTAPTRTGARPPNGWDTTPYDNNNGSGYTPPE